MFLQVPAQRGKGIADSHDGLFPRTMRLQDVRHGDKLFGDKDQEIVIIAISARATLLPALSIMSAAFSINRRA